MDQTEITSKVTAILNRLKSLNAERDRLYDELSDSFELRGRCAGDLYARGPAKLKRVGQVVNVLAADGRSWELELKSLSPGLRERVSQVLRSSKR